VVVRDLVFHPQSGLTLDFAEGDFGGTAEAAIIAEWEARRDAGHRTLAVLGEFICQHHRNHEQPSLFLSKRPNGQIIASHWHGSGLDGSHTIVHGVSDEHRRQVDYMQRAGEAEGFEVETEVHLPTLVIPDAVIYGPEAFMGVEVQRSKVTATLAKARTTKARHAGVLPVWFSDSRSHPAWFGQVPGVRMNPDTSWDTLPRSRSVMVVSGVREIIPRRCQSIHNGGCPQRRYGCNRWHADNGPMGVYVDDLAASVPAGKLVPVLYQPYGDQGQSWVFIVTSDDKGRFEDIAGRSGDLPLRERPRPRGDQAGRIDCTSASAGRPGRRAAPCPAHSQWPDSPWRCAVTGCPGSEQAARDPSATR
jgi:hypothetical protein